MPGSLKSAQGGYMKTMKGLELSRRFYLECGEPMLREQFGDILDLLAVGLVGSGSECFGYDDI